MGGEIGVTEARVDARIPVVVVRGRRTIALETSDVSYKGLFLCTHDPPAVRSLMRLRVTLPVREIEVHAMAVHVSATGDASEGRSAGVGVQFWGLAGPDRLAWDEFVRDLIQKIQPCQWFQTRVQIGQQVLDQTLALQTTTLGLRRCNACAQSRSNGRHSQRGRRCAL